MLPSSNPITIERVVAFGVSTIVSPIAGAFSLWIGEHFPGVHVSSASITAFAATSAAAAGLAVYKWLDGRAKHTLLALGKKSPEAEAAIQTIEDKFVQEFGSGVTIDPAADPAPSGTTTQ